MGPPFTRCVSLDSAPFHRASLSTRRSLLDWHGQHNQLAQGRLEQFLAAPDRGTYRRQAFYGGTIDVGVPS
ncbi:MAG: hypothetical protein AAF961_18215, partial [Planctomycetota bacterium]